MVNESTDVKCKGYFIDDNKGDVDNTGYIKSEDWKAEIENISCTNSEKNVFPKCTPYGFSKQPEVIVRLLEDALKDDDTSQKPFDTFGSSDVYPNLKKAI